MSVIEVYKSYFRCYIILIPIKWNRTQKNANKYENIDPEFVRKVKKHFYVDNLNSGAQSTKEGFEFYKKFILRSKCQYQEVAYQ